MIVVPALHPAHDVVVRLDDLSLGAVHRVTPDAVFTGIGGKAVNVALATAAMDVPVRLVALGDEAFLAALRRRATQHPTLEVVALPSPVLTRTDIALVEADGRLTVINATASHPGTTVVEAIVTSALYGIGAGDVVVLAGSTPHGTTEALATIARAATGHGVRVVVDASGSALTTLLETRPDVVKISAAEAADQRGTTLERVPVVGITEGAAGLRARLPEGRVVRVLPPRGLRAVATLGAGDAVTAGLAIAQSRGDNALDGFILGTAMAASTLDHLGPSVDPGAVERLRHDVRVIALDDA